MQAPPPAAAAASRSINMEKRVAEQAPQLLNLVKAARVSLEKRELAEETARVALVLDVSASMGELYATGAVQAFAERALALALQWDDDGEVDVFTVHVLFVTDGGTTDPQQTVEQLVASSFERLFWQLLVVGTVDMQVRSVYQAIPEQQKLTIWSNEARTAGLVTG
jgi:hypothetical protein